MSGRVVVWVCGVGGILLGSAFAARAQTPDKPADRASGRDAVPVRVVRPPGTRSSGVVTTHRSNAYQDTRRHARRSQRVTVRHAYDTPRNIRMRADMRTFYLPIGTITTVDPYSAAWALEAAYLARREGDRRNLLELYNFRAARERAAHVLSHFEVALDRGVSQLGSGDYAGAVASLTLAGELNRADPVSRVLLAEAHLALGHYEAAARILRHAVELQPKLIYMDLNLGAFYPKTALLAERTAALETWLGDHRATADAHFMLGFLRYQLGEHGKAYEALTRVANARPCDTLTRDFLAIAQPEQP